MKKTILTLIATFMTLNSAQASFYVIECSTASGNTTYVTGHNSKAKVTQIDWRPYKETIVDITNLDVNFEEIGERTEISSHSSSKCGISTWSSHYAVKAKMSVEGSKFSSNVADSIDGVIEKTFLCEESGNSMMLVTEEELKADPDCN